MKVNPVSHHLQSCYNCLILQKDNLVGLWLYYHPKMYNESQNTTELHVEQVS